MSGSLKKHNRIQKNLESRLKDYGYKVYTNIEYYKKEWKTLGEIDVLAFKVDDEGYLKGLCLYEVKSGREGYRHATEQLKRAKNYFTPTGGMIVPKMVCVTEDRHGALRAKRVR